MRSRIGENVQMYWTFRGSLREVPLIDDSSEIIGEAGKTQFDLASILNRTRKWLRLET